MTHKTARIDDIVYFWFGINTSSGSGGDGTSEDFDVRIAGAPAGDPPVLSGAPVLLAHANFPAGAYEIAVDASTANGFSSGDEFAVFATLLIGGNNPTGFVGSCKLTPVHDEVMHTQMVESYAAPGVAPTPAQAVFAIHQQLQEMVRSGTLLTVMKLDGVTPAYTMTLDNGETPGSIVRTT